MKNKGVNVVLGWFKEKDRHCKACGATFKAREEKTTDVNIALYIFKEAMLNNYDTAVVLTTDTDLIPAIEIVKSHFPHKRLGILFPLNRWSEELKDACHFWRRIEKRHLSKCQLPDQISLKSGVILNRPKEWT